MWKTLEDQEGWFNIQTSDHDTVRTRLVQGTAEHLVAVHNEQLELNERCVKLLADIAPSWLPPAIRKERHDLLRGYYKDKDYFKCTD